jgi:hypothetical protein
MSILCRIFGHIRHAGWYGDGLYSQIHIGAIDNLGSIHFRAKNTCDRCGETYILARFHYSQVKKHIDDLKARNLLPENQK